MNWGEYLEGKETVIVDGVEYPKSWLDEHGDINAEMFNAMVAEPSAHGDPNEFADDNPLDEYPEHYGAAFETLPEMDIIERNIGII